MNPSSLEICPGCLRAARDAHAAIAACAEPAQSAPGRCLWRARCLAPAVAVDGEGPPVDPQARPDPPEEPAPDSPETFRELLGEERAARRALRERLHAAEALAAEAQALRALATDELHRLSAERDHWRAAAEAAQASAGRRQAATELERPGPGPAASSSRPFAPPFAPPFTPPLTPSPKRPLNQPRNRPGSAARALGWLSLGLVVGAGLGLFLPNWEQAQVREAVLALAAPILPPPVRSEPASSAGPRLPVVAAQPGTAAPSGGIVAVNAASAPLEAAAPATVASGADALAVMPPAAGPGPADPARTALGPGAVGEPALLAGAQAAAETAAVGPSPPSEPLAPRRARTSSPPAAGKPHPEELALGAIVPTGALTLACRDSVADTPADVRAAEFQRCMRQSCCASDARHGEECGAFDRRYPLHCDAS